MTDLNILRFALLKDPICSPCCYSPLMELLVLIMLACLVHYNHWWPPNLNIIIGLIFQMLGPKQIIKDIFKLESILSKMYVRSRLIETKPPGPMWGKIYCFSMGCKRQSYAIAVLAMKPPSVKLLETEWANHQMTDLSNLSDATGVLAMNPH